MSQFLRHENCPSCGSSDNLAIYDDHKHCFSYGCNYQKQYNIKEGAKEITEEKLSKPLTYPVSSKPFALKERGLDTTSIKKYKIAVFTNPESKIEAVFPRFNQEGQHVANQIRYRDKNFSSEGRPQGCKLFGQEAFQAGGKSVTITEGYYDAPSAFQLTGSRYPNVAVQSASSAKKEVIDNFEWINSFESVIVNLDNDEVGQKAAKEIASLFKPGKVRLLTLTQGKDANEYLQKSLTKQYIDEWFRAAPFMPDGLQLGSDPSLIEDIIKYKEPRSIPYPWEGLNNKTYGIRTSELILLTADTGVGKTSVIKEIEYAILMHPDLIAENAGVGFLHLEEPKRDLAVGLMSVHNSKPYHFPDVERTEEELREAYKAVLDTSRVVIWDHFGSNDIDIVLAKIEHMAALGCRYVMVDHLSIIVSDQSGDERKQLDEISTKIKTLTMRLDIACFCVIHINRQGQVRGSAGPEQVANIVIRLERDKKEANEWRRNITRLSVEKNRKFGRTGPACYLHYDEMTGRLHELSKDLIQEYEQGGSGAGHEFATM